MTLFFRNLISILPRILIMSDTPELYHYTDKAGLFGMAQNKTLWLTNVRFMNDKTEFNYGLNLVKKFIEAKYDKRLGQFLNDKELRFEEVPYTFSFSLSENKDTLSQWRGYCPKGGFSLSFDKEMLDSLLRKNNLRIQQCFYEQSDIEKFIIQEIVRMTPEEYQKSVDMPFYNKGMERMPFDLVSRVFSQIPFIKDIGFKEEKEWRIVKHDHHEKPIAHQKEIKYRDRNNKKIPYLEYSIDGLERSLIKGALLFPIGQDSESIQEVKNILNSENVFETEIPYQF